DVISLLRTCPPIWLKIILRSGDLTIQIVMAGTGGQGILFAARVLQQAAVEAGFNIIGSETHGMSQRGGSVVAHLKIGDAKSPLIRRNSADILYSIHHGETIVNLPFLRDGGFCFVNSSINSSEYNLPADIGRSIKKKKVSFFSVDADKLALETGSILSANLVLLGYSLNAGILPFSLKHLHNAVRKIGKGRAEKANLAAVDAGFQYGKTSLSCS
ncbi:MAG: indolepyruvate oxidoreductase subunit beta, partial [Planctomycetota bacterium]